MDYEFQQAVRQHQLGALAVAASIYQRVLARLPRHADAMHLLGVAALQQGDPARAAELIRAALAIEPRAAGMYANLAEAYRTLKDETLALKCCEQALRLQPRFVQAVNTSGLICMAQGRFQDAVAHFRRALEWNPNAESAHNNLGNAYRELGLVDEAIARFREAIRLAPNMAEGHSNLGQMLLEQKKTEDAICHCREAVRLNPNLASAHSNLGNVLRKQGNLSEARACYDRALKLNPEVGLVYSNMAQSLQEEGRIDDAVAWYSLALERESHSAKIHTYLASALAAQDKDEQAVECYRTALRIDPKHLEAHTGLGWLRQEQGRYEEAEACYRRALEIKPERAGTHNLLGMMAEELGDFSKAKGCLQAALTHEPDNASTLAALATLLKGDLPEEVLLAAERLVDEPGLTLDDRAGLHFGLGHVHDAKRSFGMAGHHLERANALALESQRMRVDQYDPADHTRLIDEIIECHASEFFERTRGFGVDAERPVFIVGLPRSGTTLIEQILSRHSCVFGAGELTLAPQIFRAMRAGQKNQTQRETWENTGPDLVRTLAEGHLRQLSERNSTAARIVDKLPDNYLHLGMLATLFPQAKFIHCRRDLRDVAVSCWMTNFRSIRWANNRDHISHRFEQYERLTAHWRDVLPVSVLEVPYEETVADLEGTARRLVAWCGLDWEPDCVKFHENHRPVRTASVLQVRQAVYTSSVARWKNYGHSLGGLFARLQALQAVELVMGAVA